MNAHLYLLETFKPFPEKKNQQDISTTFITLNKINSICEYWINR